jgi:hypothetical protein
MDGPQLVTRSRVDVQGPVVVTLGVISVAPAAPLPGRDDVLARRHVDQPAAASGVARGAGVVGKIRSSAMAAASLVLAALLLWIASLLLLSNQKGPLMPAMWLAGLVSLAAFWVFESQQVAHWAERWPSRGSLPGVVLLVIGLSAALALIGWRLEAEWLLLICGVLTAVGLLCAVGYLVIRRGNRRRS